MSFETLNLSEPILRALRNEGYTTPTPIQQQAIPVILEGHDLLGSAQTGTGKTAAFAIPVLQHLLGEKPQQRRAIRALVLTPTRELAVQVGDSFAAYGKFTNLFHTVIYGGVSQHSQVQKVRRGVDILVATPGRLLDLMNQGHIDLRHVQYFVLDEVDRMLDMGFVHDVKRIIAKIPQKRQTMFFSATMPSQTSELAYAILRDPVSVEVTPTSSTAETISHSLYMVDKGNKFPLLRHILEDSNVGSVLVFTRTKRGADKVARQLNQSNILSDAIHGNKTQAARQKALKKFKAGQVRVLVATDIAARGIDIDYLSHVINFEMPMDPETYVHRIGRTGRAGASGVALSFCDREERSQLKEINKLLGTPIPVVEDHPYPAAVIKEVPRNPNGFAQRAARGRMSRRRFA